ncbi:hypothetical protein GRI38_04295 [Altererythrobacter aurantiacus]|uniref:Uncharacterized protein n=1 Tax=Parapontixanthobacter aurantiacus TaxID=1463599 RepID=A0A844ZDE8_9SPHN|nr:hypothetical protein [Parapontixanthobacter aurantiacus]MXO85243.1 hypothetical protein [Parapontixanthobacter aurantiacus]
MTLDTRIPLMAAQGAQVNLADIAQQAERYKALRAQREAFEAETERKTNARKSLADLILSQHEQAPGTRFGEERPAVPPEGLPDNRAITPYPLTNPAAMGMSDTPATRIAMSGQPQQEEKPDPWAEYVKYDPEGAIDFRASTAEWQQKQLETASDLNEQSMQLLGGVHDQPSYNRARAMAYRLYSQYGIDPAQLQLPDQYSPELVRELQMQGMETRKQLQTVLDERKLDWDIEDDQIDNERMDRNTDSLIDTREERLDEYRRANRVREATTRRGQDLTDTRVRRGQDISSRDRRRGQDIRPTRGNRQGPARPTATDANGNKIQFDGKKWVPVK